MHRRRALQLLGALAAVPALPALRGFSESELLALGERVHEGIEGHPYEPRALTPKQLRVVEIAAEHIIPRTHTPGATDARVADFIDAMLADWHPPAERERFITGLAELDRRASDGDFSRAVSAQRIALLATLDDEVASLRRSDAQGANQHWFSTLKFLTVWGYYTSRVGITDELRVDMMPGRYDGDAEYLGA